MKLVFLDTTMHGSLIGGAHTFMHELIKGFVASGHETHFITRGSPTAKTAVGIDKYDAHLHTDLWTFADLVEDAGPVLAKWVNDLAPDVFLISTSTDIGWVVLPMLDVGIATLAIGHNDSATYYDPATHYRDFLTRVVGVSQVICETYVERCEIDAGQVDWIPYGVRTSETPPAEMATGPLRIVYVGRLEEEQKRFADIIKVAKRLSEDGVDFVLRVVGDGVSMPFAKRELASEIVSGKVTMHGWLDGDEVIDIVRGSEVFVLASAFEGFCIALVEAMANGCAPIVTDIRSGSKQLVQDGENGFVVPIGDVDTFVEKITYLSKTPNKLLEFRQKAWETGKEYSIGRMIESYERCFERAIEDARVNPRTPDDGFPLMESCRSKYPLWLRRIVAKFRS